MTTRDPIDDTALLPEPLRVDPDAVKTAAAAAAAAAAATVARRPLRVGSRHDIDYGERVDETNPE